MDFGQIGFTEEQIDMLNVAQAFCKEKSPINKVRDLMTDDAGYDIDIWEEIGSLGWLGIAIPEEYGGVGLSISEIVPVAEQMGRYMLSSPFLSTSLAAQALIAGGTAGQKKTYLSQIAAGAAATLGLSEKDGDWDLGQISATATLTDAGYSLSGTKVFVMDLRAAKWVIVSVSLGGKPALVIVPSKDIPAGSVRRETLIDETKRSYELALDGITVPNSAVMDMDKTAAVLDHIHLTANLLGAAELTGSCQSCIDYTVEYLNTRKQFGKLIGSFQALKHPTVDAFIDYQKSRSLLYAAAFSFAEQGTGEIATRMAKAQAVEAASFAADRSIQFHGGFGFTYDCDAQLYRRRAIFHSSQYGDARFHKKKLADLLL
jgi:alkylation response protein AidB-like acyl-CoA dehydrogenase